jgi:signal transduction histidine kinase
MSRRLRVTLVVLLSAALATAFSSTLAYQLSVSENREPSPTWLLILLNGSFWFGWAVLAFPLAALSRRLRIDRSPRVAVPAHIVALITAAVTHVAVMTSAQTLGMWLRPSLNEDILALKADGPLKYWLGLFPSQLGFNIDWELAISAGVIGFAHAFFYYRETQERSLREAQLEKNLVEAQLETLQRQLHPHFLFNTLHAISTLMHRDVNAADRMLAQLSDLLRLTLESISRPEIRLNDEIEFLEKYIEIERVRLGDRLTTQFDVDPDVLDARVPAMVLQPLVENAIKHGIAPHTRPGRITVSAKRDGDMLVMAVDDTGPGPSDRAFEALSMGIGLSNTRARLTHQFGPNFRFEFQRHRAGFGVLVAIPFRPEPPVHAAEPAYVA